MRRVRGRFSSLLFLQRSGFEGGLVQWHVSNINCVEMFQEVIACALRKKAIHDMWANPIVLGKHCMCMHVSWGENMDICVGLKGAGACWSIAICDRM